MRKWFLILIVFILLGCGDKPSNDLIHKDFQRIYPKGEIVLINPLEQSSDTYRIQISYRADTSFHTEQSGKFKEDVFLYRKIRGKWVNTWRRSSGK